MGKTLTDKILAAHLLEGEAECGKEVGIRIDQTLTQDATGTMVYLQFEAMEIPRVQTELSVSYVDHNMQQSDYRNMDDHRYLQSVASKYGIHFSRPGNGICHQVHLERFGKPGKTLLGSDSHTPTSGGLGMIAIGAGGLDLAVAMAGGAFHLSYPKVTGVHLTGKLPPMSNAKDVILTLLQTETVKGGVGRIYEYFGDGVASLSVPQRSTISNMGAELGATTSIFPSDEVTREFLARQGREEAWSRIEADKDPAYERVIELNLSNIEPMAACPHMPDNVVPVRDLIGTEIQQVAIGSCTNSSINDLGAAAAILEDETIAEGVSLGVSPGSKQVLDSAMSAGIISSLVSSGARILESACGPCIGMGFAPNSGGVSLRTFNRNFKGRSGTTDAQVYLVSPETAAASALMGAITDPRDFADKEARDYSSFIRSNDNLIVAPAAAEEAGEIELSRGPNIQPCPSGSPLPEKLEAEVLLVTGNNITTDDIMPAGSKILPLRSNIPEISKHVFESIDADFYNRAMAAGDGVIIGGENYGQGSSREHAALAPMYLGVRAVIAKSFARIHKANLVNFGILPLCFADPADYDTLTEGLQVSIENLHSALNAQEEGGAGDGDAVLYLRLEKDEKEEEIRLLCDLDAGSREIVLAGGKLAYMKRQGG